MTNRIHHAKARRIRRVQLVGLDDPGYRALCRRHALQEYRIGPRCPPSACCQVASVFEQIVRRRLSGMTVLRPERVLAFEIQDGPYGYRPQYLEIDAVSGSIGAELLLFEIKATHRRRHARQGFEQLRRARDVARIRGGRISLVVVWVDTGLEATSEGPRRQTSELAELQNLEAIPRWKTQDDRPAFVRIPGSDAWSWAAEEGLHVDDDLWRRTQQELRTTRERRALKAAGVPLDERPAGTEVREQRRPSGVYVAGPTKAPDTALSTALRRALEKADTAAGSAARQQHDDATRSAPRRPVTSKPRPESMPRPSAGRPRVGPAKRPRSLAG